MSILDDLLAYQKRMGINPVYSGSTMDPWRVQQEIRGILAGRDLRGLGLPTTQSISRFTGPLPGDVGMEDPGGIATAWKGLLTGAFEPFVGLAERLRLISPGSREKMRRTWETTRDRYLANDPTLLRTAVAGLSEATGSFLPMFPTIKAGTALTRAGMGKAATILPSAAEGGLAGLGVTAGMGQEETVLGTALGLALGSGGGIAARFVGKKLDPTKEFIEQVQGVGRWLKEEFTVGGKLPEEMRLASSRAAGEIAAAQLEASSHIALFEEAWQSYLKKHPNTDVPAMLKRLNRWLQLRPTDRNFLPGVYNIPVELREPMKLMRDALDNWSTRMLEHPGVPKALKERIEKNLGSYIHYSHEFFDNPEFVRILKSPEGQERWNAMADFLQREKPDWLPSEIQAHMHLMLEKPFSDYPATKIFGAGMGRAPLVVQKQRGAIAPEVREFYGLYENPLVNYWKSVQYMAADLAYHDMYREIRKIALQTGMARELPRPNEVYKWAVPGGRSRAPLTSKRGLTKEEAMIAGEVRAEKLGLNPEDIDLRKNRWMGLYFKDEAVVDAITGVDEIMSYSAVQLNNAIVKMMKTGYSLQTHARNFLSGNLMLMMQGHVPNMFDRRSLKAALVGMSPGGALGKLGRRMLLDAQAREDYSVLLRHGYVRQGAHQRDIEFYRQFVGQQMDDGNLVSRAFKKLGKKLVPKKLADVMERAYQGEDDFWKLQLYRKELDAYERAGLGFEEAQQRALRVVRDTMQLYDLVPPAIKKLRRTPIIGPFVSFPSEIIRNAKNTLRLIAEEVADPRPGIKKIGARRAAGMFSALAFPSVAVQLGRHLSGTTAEEEKHLRRFVPPWNKGSQLSIYNWAPGKSAEYLDLSFMDPYAILKKPFVAALRTVFEKDNAGLEAILSGISELADPFIQPEIAWSEAKGLIQEWGIMSEKSLPAKLELVMKRLWRTYAPGTALSVERILRGLEVPGVRQVLPSSSMGGRRFQPIEESLALAGPRMIEIDFNKALEFRAGKFARTKLQASMLYNREAKRKRSQHLVAEARREAEEMYRRGAEELILDVKAAQGLGMPNPVIYRMLRLKIGDREARMILRHKVPPRKFLVGGGSRLL